MRYLEHHSASLEQDARQPRLVMEADGPANTKTRERTESAATAVQAMRGGSFSARRVEPGPNTTRPVSACRPNLPLSLAGMTSESRAAMPHPGRVSHPWRGAYQQPRWLTSHRRSLYSYEDHFQRATSSVLHDRGDRFRGQFKGDKSKDFDSIRLVQQQRLPAE